MRRIVGSVACLLGFAMCIFFGLLAALHWVGTDAELYYALQMKAGILDSAGISGETLRTLDEALSDCLKGDAAALDMEAEVFGVVQPAFNEKERIHMEDCRKLFELLRAGIRVSGIAGVLLLTLGCVLLREDRRSIRLTAGLSPLMIVIPLGMLAVWAMIDFNAAFNFFHEILFTNDLWLLNPATDLLIRICPISMFMSMGARIGLIALAWAVFIPALAMVLTAKKERI